MQKIFLLLCVVLLQQVAAAQMNDRRAGQLDVTHYRFELRVNDLNDSIRGVAAITVQFLQDVTSFDVDLTYKKAGGKGMVVDGVEDNKNPVPFFQQADTLRIKATAHAGEIKTYEITYGGIPADGLVIAKNKYGHRTFFSDNWPNRAHNWIPCIDHPSDKASVEFIVTAPDHYQVISNGLQVESTNLPNGFKLTHWKETVVLPTKIMVIGLADFAVDYAGDVDCVPVYSWVYPEDRDKGFYDYGLAKDILPWFIKNVGPYSYRKLANVQSKTIFGGMENASAIFYSEKSIQGDRKVESLLTHEIAHQWFGDAATEKNWQHIWLSEGFATYMTHLYLGEKYGKDSLQKRMQEDRAAVIAFSQKRNTPVVDETVTSDYMELLNANSYQKGGWVLHMLKHKLGDAIFMNGIRAYYKKYMGSNAGTEDLQAVMENTSGIKLDTFFRQWLYTPGQPNLLIKWHYDVPNKNTWVTITQMQNTPFLFPVDLALVTGKDTLLKTFAIQNRVTVLRIKTAEKPSKLVIDPDTRLLLEAVVEQGKP